MNDLAMALIPAAVAIVMGLLIRGSGEAPTTTSDGALVLRYPPLLRGFLAFAAIGAVALAGVGLALAFGDDMPSWGRAALALASIALFAPIPYLWGERDITVLVDENGIHLRDWRRRHRSIAWDELSELRYSVGNHWWKLKARSGDVLRVSSLLKGAKELPQRIRHHVSGPRWRRWSTEIERVRSQD